MRLNPSLVVLAARDVQVRSPFCSLWKASQDGRIKLRQQALTDEIARSSRLVRRDGDLALWSTPRGEFWVPHKWGVGRAAGRRGAGRRSVSAPGPNARWHVARSDSFVEENEATEKVGGIPVTTIDKLAAELGLTRIDFIKANVKGATERLLRGGSAVIRRDRPRVALSTEEVADNAPEIAKLAHTIQPAYQLKCGPCLTDGKAIYTDVLFLR